MNDVSEAYRKTEKLWQQIAWIAGAFTVVVAVLLIINFFQLNRADPVNTKILDSLVERLNQNPGDEELREQIRTMDLLARKAYFTSRWQIRTGGYLVLMGIAVVIIAFQVILYNRKKEPSLSDEKMEDLILTQKTARTWITAGGFGIVALALVFAYLSHQNLQRRFEQAAAGPELVEGEEEIAVDQVPEQKEDPNPGPEEIAVDQPEDTLSEVIEQPIEEEREKELSAESKNQAEVQVPAKSSTVKSATGTFAVFRGPGGNGIAGQKNIPVDWDGASGKNIRWKLPVSLPGFNSPILWENRIFLTGADENTREVYCVDADAGNILWTVNVTNVPGSPSEHPEVANYTGYAAPTAATDGSYVFAIFANGDLIALDMEGTRVWAKNIGVPVNHYGHSSSLLIHKDKLLVQYDQKDKARVLALSVSTGELVWEAKRDVKVSWASPILVNINGRDELILASEPWLVSYNPDTGEEWWRIEGVIGEVGPSPAYANGIVFAVNDYSRFVAVKMGSEPEILWEDEEYLSDIPSPVANASVVIAPTSYGVVACYDPQTGDKFWEYELDYSIYASPLITEDKVYLTDRNGTTHIFKADKELNVIGTPELGEKVVCTPAFSDGRIYIRGYDHRFCIGSE
jgi:outer membrane protein assembly factor BamB